MNVQSKLINGFGRRLYQTVKKRYHFDIRFGKSSTMTVFKLGLSVFLCATCIANVAYAGDNGARTDQLRYSSAEPLHMSQSRMKSFEVLAQELDVGVIAFVEKSEQKLHVFVGGKKQFTWDVSTARRGKVTPSGIWSAQWLSKHHRSSLYNNAPMPYSIFYNGNFAIHGTNQLSKLGSPASAGCVRLHPKNAKILFDLVRAAGKSEFRVLISD